MQTIDDRSKIAEKYMKQLLENGDHLKAAKYLYHWWRFEMNILTVKKHRRIINKHLDWLNKESDILDFREKIQEL